MNNKILVCAFSLIVFIVLCHTGWGQEEEVDYVQYQGPNPYFTDTFFPFERNGRLQEFIYLIFKYGQATCVEPLYDLAARMCKTDMVQTPFEPYIDLCIGCMLIRDLDKCFPPCSPSNYTCQFYPNTVDIVGAYNFFQNAQSGLDGFSIDQRG